MESSDKQTFSQDKCLKDIILKFNVSGTRFETSAATLEKHRESKLAKFVDGLQTEEYFIDRDPEVFKVILNYYRFGELHVPPGICRQVFQKELEYWEITENNIEQCCWASYYLYHEKKKTLAKMKEAIHRPYEELKISESSTKWQIFQRKGWIFLEDPNSSRTAMTYAWISAFFILLSISALCLETVPSLRLGMTTEDWADYHSIPLKDLYYMHHYTNDDPSDATRTGWDDAVSPAENVEAVIDKGDINYPQRETATNQQLERDNSTNADSGGSVPLKDPVLKRRPLSTQAPDSPRDLQKLHPAFFYIDCTCTCYFVIDTIARLIFSPRKCKFLIHPLTIVDLLSIFGTGLNVVIQEFFPHETYQENAIDIVFALFRCIRIFRVFRLVRHYSGLLILLYTLKASVKEIILLLTFFSISMLLFGCLMYFTDDNEKFTSIPLSCWFALVTMTTVGYGDMYPSTAVGYVIGSFCALSGVFVISLTVPVIVNNFMFNYSHAQLKVNAQCTLTTLNDSGNPTF